MNASMQNLLLFVVLPYVAIAVFAVGTIVRYRNAPHTFTSRSSQFLEGQRHFWALTAFHFGVLVTFVGHVAGLVTPARMHVWTATPFRMHVVEVIGATGGLMALIGIGLVMLRRLHVPLVRSTTKTGDVLVLALLALQLCTGVYVALSRPWGAAWFEALVGPYVRSLLMLTPDTSYVAPMPLAVKVHLVNAWIIIAVFPFTRLVHMLAAPVPYLWRRVLMVRWMRTRIATEPAVAMKLARAAGARRG